MTSKAQVQNVIMMGELQKDGLSFCCGVMEIGLFSSIMDKLKGNDYRYFADLPYEVKQKLIKKGIKNDIKRVMRAYNHVSGFIATTSSGDYFQQMAAPGDGVDFQQIAAEVLEEIGFTAAFSSVNYSDEGNLVTLWYYSNDN